MADPDDDIPQYDTWQKAALGGNLLTHIGRNWPSMKDIVPGYDPNESTVQKLADYGSVPARIALAPILEGGHAFKSWMQGDQGPETKKQMLGALLGTGIASRAFGREPGSFGVFGGENAATADITKLRMAKQMEAGTHEVSMDKGKTWRSTGTPATSEEIWKHTGWFKDMDGKWKFEIPDTDAKWKTGSGAPTVHPSGDVTFPIMGRNLRLGDAIDHPQLFAAYPELADTPLHSTGLFAGLSGLKGAVYSDGSIGLTAGKPKDVLSTGLHEVQHVIQEQEGFARGGSMKEFLPQDFTKAHEDALQAMRPMENELRSGNVNAYAVGTALKKEKAGVPLNRFEQEHLDSARRFVNEDFLNRFHDQSMLLRGMNDLRQGAFKDYESLAGEVESRNVQARLEQGDYASHPHQTTGYPTDQQILRFGKAPSSQEDFSSWHGSRHLFAPTPDNPLGAFKPIEEVAHTGEGTQAFAFGHYLGGKHGTSESYMQAGGETRPQVKVDGKPYGYDQPGAQFYGIGALEEHMGNHTQAIKELREEARFLYNRGTNKANRGGDAGKEDLLDARNSLQAAKWIEENHHRVEVTPPPPGHMYQVAAKPDEHELLHWDKTLAEQHPDTRAKLEDVIDKTHSTIGVPLRKVDETYPGHIDGLRGEELYNMVAKHLGSPAAASKAFDAAGIPGVKFKDAGSRHLANDHPDATHNYVIFHHGNLKVIDRDYKRHGKTKVEDEPWKKDPSVL